MARRSRAAAAAMLAVLVVGLTPGRAAAGPVTSGATAYSAPAATGSATLGATLQLTGSIGGLFNWLSGSLTVLNQVVDVLQGSLNSIVAGTLGTSSNLKANSPAEQSSPGPGAFPGDLPSELPSPCSTTSQTRPCYSATNGVATLDLPSLVSVGVGGLSGYTQQVSTDAANPIFGRAQVSDVGVSVLPALSTIAAPIVSVGAVDSKATCPNVGGAPSVATSATQVQLLSGLLTLNLANGSIASVVVGGTTYPLNNLPAVTVAGFTLSQYGGTALKLVLALSAQQIFGALGVAGAAASTLLSEVTGAQSSLNLSVIVGSSSTTTATTAGAWGLGVGVDLSGSLGFDLLGLVGATVSVPTGIGGGNLGNILDLRLAYTSCASGSGGGPGSGSLVVPPALI